MQEEGKGALWGFVPPPAPRWHKGPLCQSPGQLLGTGGDGHGQLEGDPRVGEHLGGAALQGGGEMSPVVGLIGSWAPTCCPLPTNAGDGEGKELPAGGCGEGGRGRAAGWGQLAPQSPTMGPVCVARPTEDEEQGT